MSTMETIKQLGETITKSRFAASTQEIEFSIVAPAAKKVCLAGQFNDWDPKSMSMKKGKDGAWKIKMKLPQGRYEYKYLVDGSWVQDLSNAETTPNPFGTKNCVINVR